MPYFESLFQFNPLNKHSSMYSVQVIIPMTTTDIAAVRAPHLTNSFVYPPYPSRIPRHPMTDQQCQSFQIALLKARLKLFLIFNRIQLHISTLSITKHVNRANYDSVYQKQNREVLNMLGADRIVQPASFSPRGSSNYNCGVHTSRVMYSSAQLSSAQLTEQASTRYRRVTATNPSHLSASPHRM